MSTIDNLCDLAPSLESLPSLTGTKIANAPKVTTVTNAPVQRRLYKRNGVIHLCGGGNYFGPDANTSKFPLDEEVYTLALDDGTVAVFQDPSGHKEIWSMVEVPRGPARGKKMTLRK